MSGTKQPISVGPADRCQCPYGGHRFRTVFAANSNDFVHAINAFDVARPPAVSAGTILWRKSLGRLTNFGLDGGVAMAILGRPIVALDATPPTMHVAADATDDSGRALESVCAGHRKRRDSTALAADN
jgi:hypothetical protein